METDKETQWERGEERERERARESSAPSCCHFTHDRKGENSVRFKSSSFKMLVGHLIYIWHDSKCWCDVILVHTWHVLKYARDYFFMHDMNRNAHVTPHSYAIWLKILKYDFCFIYIRYMSLIEWVMSHIK